MLGTVTGKSTCLWYHPIGTGAIMLSKCDLLARALLAICFTAVMCSPAASQIQRTSPAGRSVTIASEPNAAVWIDGILFGKCDKTGTFAVRALGPGTHTIKVR